MVRTQDSQLSEYWLKVLDEYRPRGLSLGRNGQEGEEVYILSEKVQVKRKYITVHGTTLGKLKVFLVFMMHEIISC